MKFQETGQVGKIGFVPIIGDPEIKQPEPQKLAFIYFNFSS